MKLVKNLQFGTITTSIDGSIYVITGEGTQVPDEIAAKLKEQFLHNIDVGEIAPVEPPKEETATVEEPKSPVDEKPRKRGRPAKE